MAQAGAEDPRVLSRGRIELCDPHEPDSRQPYHAGFGTEQHDTAIIGRLVAIVERCARDSVGQLVVRCRQDGMPVSSAGLVVGSDIDPATIANPHIRAHASEGRLFRRVAEDALREAGVPSTVWVEKRLYADAARALGRTEASLKRTVAEMGRGLAGGWRAEDKGAALAAWLSRHHAAL
ncbi:MAG: hypothetical protein DMF85_14365 [Acidobacteria bacterium]|nr:MAG: hypothetical protein DMF85_14365 [Acidobacteriota bacterium]